MRVQGQEEGPFERQKAPHAGEIEASWVGGSCVTGKNNNIEIQNITFTIMYAVSTRNNKNRITLLLCDGKSEEDDEGSHCQNWEEHANGDEELEAFEPGAPVVLQVHDVCDECPERQNPCQRQDFISNVHAKRNCTGLVEYHDKAETLVN